MKILCLHGYGQDADLFKQRGKQLFKFLERNNTLFFPIGLYDVTMEKDNIKRHGKAWFYYDINDPSNFVNYLNREQATWHGLDRTIEYFKDYVLEHGPFDYILGFSQGAQIATILATELSNIRGLILFSGFIQPYPDNYPINKNTLINIKSLHIIGRKDEFISNNKSDQLSKLFKDAQILYHHKGHTIAQHSEIKRLLGYF